jgi:hypothetical protein
LCTRTRWSVCGKKDLEIKKHSQRELIRSTQMGALGIQEANPKAVESRPAGDVRVGSRGVLPQVAGKTTRPRVGGGRREPKR